MYKLQVKPTLDQRFKTDSQFKGTDYDDMMGRARYLLHNNFQVRIMTRDSFGTWYELRTLKNTGHVSY